MGFNSGFKGLNALISITSSNQLCNKFQEWRFITPYLLTPRSRVLLEKLTGCQPSQEIPRILWNPKVHYHIHKCPPPVPILSKQISVWTFRNMISLYGEELLALRPTPKPEDRPLSVVRDCLFNIFAATLHIGGRSSHSQPEDAPCRGDRDPLITEDSLRCLYELVIEAVLSQMKTIYIL